MDLKKLYAPFDLKERAGLGGMKFKYIPSDDVIDRMNQVFGGRWSTEVRNEDKHEDMVVVRVRVCVWDVDDKMEYCHDGYGSAQVARYASGQNKGQAIDMGNAYKSAETKAIRNACTRFGVGLYLEKDAYNETGIVEAEHTVQEVQVVEKPVVPSIPVPPTPKASPEAPKAPMAPVPPTPKASPETPKAPPSPFGDAKPSPFPSTPAPKETPAPKAVVAPTPAPEAPAPSVSPKTGSPSDVQKAALAGMVTLTGLSLNSLLTSAFEEAGLDTSNIPESIDDLDYTQAVVAIKFGSTYKK